MTEKNFLKNLGQLFTGNSFINNLNVMDMAIFKQADIRNNLNVKGYTNLNKIKANEIETSAFNITENKEIIFDPDAILKFSTNSKINFQVKDLFEVIIFLKFLKRTCGNKLEKCDLGNLLKTNKNKFSKIFKKFEKKLENFDAKIKENITNVVHNVFEKERNNTMEIISKKEKENELKEKKIRAKLEKEEKKLKEKLKEIEKEKKELELKEEKIKKMKIKKKFDSNKSADHSKKNDNKNDNKNEKKNEKKNNDLGFLSKGEKINNDIENDNKFYEKLLLNDEDEAYEKFFTDPQLSNAISSYYYNMR